MCSKSRNHNGMCFTIIGIKKMRFWCENTWKTAENLIFLTKKIRFSAVFHVFSHQNLIFLIPVIVKHMPLWFLLLEHIADLVQRFKLSQTPFFTDFWSKQISDFSLKILTLPLGIHLKKLRSVCNQYPNFDLFTSHVLCLHSLVLQLLKKQKVKSMN